MTTFGAIPRLGPETHKDVELVVAVEPSEQTIRALLLRKVYTIMFLQILGTAAVAAAVAAAGADE